MNTNMNSPKTMVMCKSGRLDCIARAFLNGTRKVILCIMSEVKNPGLSAKTDEIWVGKTDDVQEVEKCVREFKPDFVVIGPEEPLAAAVVDKLRELGIPAVGPTRALAQLETSKSFTRELLGKHDIP